MNDPMQHTLKSLGTSDFIFELSTRDLDDAQARHRLRDGAGASIAWTTGHLLSYRHKMMTLVDGDIDDPYAAQFDYPNSATDGADYPTIGELRTRWSETSARVTKLLADAGDALLTRPAPQAGPHGEKTVLDELVFYHWHEAYHMGHFGALRAELGLPTPAQVVMSEQQKGQG